MDGAFSLWGLFASSFLAATLLPGGSEIVLGWLAADGAHSPSVLLGVATLGNTLGGMSSWGMGRLIAWRYPAEALAGERRRSAVQRLRRWGAPALLLAWLPVVGDPLCVAAGWLKVSWWWAVLLIGVGKGARYVVVLWVVTG